MPRGNYVPGSGNPEAKIIIVGEAPGAQEDALGLPFVGPSGEMLNEMLGFSGTSRKEVYVTNVFKYRPPNNDLSRIGEVLSKEEQAESVERLWREIELRNPNVIIALGSVALSTLTGQKGLRNRRGSVLRSLKHNKKVIPTYHPATLLPGTPTMMPYSYRAFIQLDLIRAVKQSARPDFEGTNRNLLIARSSLDVYNFIHRAELDYGDDLAFASDIETYHSIPTCISLAPSPTLSMSIPLVNMKGIDSFVIENHDMQEVWRIVAKVLDNPRIKKIGHNFKFDQERLLNTCLMTLRGFHADTMLMGHTLYPEFPRALYFYTSIYTSEPYYKEEYKEFNPKKDPITQILRYNARDSAVTFEVWRGMERDLDQFGLRSFYYDYVHKLHDFYFELEDYGFKYNLVKQAELKAKYEKLAKESEEGFFKIIGKDFDSKFINSPAKIARLLYDDLGFPPRDNTEEDTLVALLANHTAGKPERAAVINSILDTRRLKKAISTYICAPPDYDGRMRSSYNILGTETGRSSTGKYGSKSKKSGKGRSPIRPSEVGLAFQTVPERGFGHEIQTAFEADEGYELFAIDLSQAEARVVALLAEDYDLLEMFNTIDIHKRTASWFFGKPDDQITPEERFIGKIGRHGGNYDMQKGLLCNTIMSEARRAGIKVIVSEKDAGGFLRIFHEFSPKIRGTFHKAVQEALRSNGRVIVTPHGRRRKFYGRWTEDTFREAYATIPQPTVRDHLSQAGLRIRARAGFIQILKESHDAFKGQYPIEKREEARAILLEELQSPISFANCTIRRGNLIIPAELKVGQNLGEMVKVKG